MKASEYFENKLNTKFSPAIAGLINPETKVITFPAGRTVLWEGDIAQNLYYILKGIVRGYYIDNKGNDMTKCFSVENEFFSTEGFRMSLPATFSIECLEDCKCVQLPYLLLRRIINQDKEIGAIVSKLFQSEVSKQENRSKNLMLLSAEERYAAFTEEYPHLHKRIALKYIASYIGVRPASLSRIRKSIKPNKN